MLCRVAYAGVLVLAAAGVVVSEASIAPSAFGVYVDVRTEARRILDNDPSLGDLRRRSFLEWSTLVMGSLFGREADERTRLLGAAALCAIRVEAMDHEQRRQRPAAADSERPPRRRSRAPSRVGGES